MDHADTSAPAIVEKVTPPEERAAPDLLEALEECAEFLADQADAEYFTDSAAPVPNKAMRLLVTVQEAIANARARHSDDRTSAREGTPSA